MKRTPYIITAPSERGVEFAIVWQTDDGQEWGAHLMAINTQLEDVSPMTWLRLIDHAFEEFVGWAKETGNIDTLDGVVPTEIPEEGY